MCLWEMIEDGKHGLGFLLKSSSNWGTTLSVTKSLQCLGVTYLTLCLHWEGKKDQRWIKGQDTVVLLQYTGDHCVHAVSLRKCLNLF